MIKKSISHNIIIVVTSILSGLLISCNTCTEQMTSERSVKLKFGKVSGKTYADTTINTLNIIIEKGSGLTDTAYGVSKFSLPLDESKDTTKFILVTDSLKNVKYRNKHTDTLTFVAKRDLELISADCGFNTRFTNIQGIYTKNHIDTVLINNKNISSDLNSLNFTIVLKVNPQ